MVNKVHEYGKKVGIVINPYTPVINIIEFLPKIDYVLILGVNPGYSGQSFIPSTIKKLEELAKLKDKYSFQIDIDGGITIANSKELHHADIISSSSAILNSKDPNHTIQIFRSL